MATSKPRGVVITVDDPAPVRALVITDEMRAAFVRQGLEELRRFAKRYRALDELAPVIKAIDAVRRKARKGGK